MGRWQCSYALLWMKQEGVTALCMGGGGVDRSNLHAEPKEDPFSYSRGWMC